MTSDALIEKFIYSCSHDLRGPVTSIQGLVRLANEYPQSVDIHDCIRMIGECSGKLELLIQGLQQFMEIEAMQIQPEEVQVMDVIDSAIAMFSKQIQEYRVAVVRKDRPMIWKTNFYLASEIITKLISNSIAFRDTGKVASNITIDLTRERNSLFLEIRDNGLGIPADLQSRLFSPFFRAHAISSGPGLGLFLVKRMVKKLAGDVIIKSAEQVGTTVIIKLPLVSGRYSI